MLCLRSLLYGAVAAFVVAAVVWGYGRSGMVVTLTVDGETERLRTHRANVGQLLDDLGLQLGPLDRLSPDVSTALSPGMEITIQRARHILIEADGRRWEIPTWAETVQGVLEDAGLKVSTYDRLWLNGEPATPETRLPSAPVPSRSLPRAAPGRARLEDESPSLTLKVRRAVRLTVQDEGPPFTVYTTASTIGEALRAEQVVLYLGDLVRPSLESRVVDGMHVVIQRSTPIVLMADGRTFRTRTRQKTVAEALAEQGITLVGMDRVTPDLSEAVADNMTIRVTRVREAIEIEQEVVPYDTVLEPDDELEIDYQKIAREGAEGITKWRYRVIYEDGKPISRTLEDAWVAQEPITRVIAYGRKIVLRELVTPEGTFRYWRKVRMLATSYSASTAGVSPSDPHYGQTRLGLTMRGGIVAVDPRVINLGSTVYVPGYGVGYVGDTGGAIIGRRIDLGYDDDKLVHWYRWVDVYLLEPVPPPYQIRYILPNWPREGR